MRVSIQFGLRKIVYKVFNPKVDKVAKIDQSYPNLRYLYWRAQYKLALVYNIHYRNPFPIPPNIVT